MSPVGEPFVKTNLGFPPVMLEEVREYAKRKQVSMAEIIRRAVDEFLQKREAFK